MGVYYPYMGTGATCNQITTPLVYDESLSIAQQIACIFGALKTIEETSVDATELQALRDYFDAMQKAQTDALEKYADAVGAAAAQDLANETRRLEALIADVTAGALSILDPTMGQSRRSADVVVERVYDFDRYFAITAKDCDACGLTAMQQSEAGYTARDYDTCGSMVMYRFRKEA